METLNVSMITHTAREKLEGKDSRKLAVFHTGITVAAALVVTLLQYVLAEGIGNTSGLSGLGTRSVLQTIQTVLQWANTLLMPFWGLGFLYASMRWARGESAKRQDLLTGFRRWGPYLGLLLNRTMLTIGVLILCTNLSGMLYMILPASSTITGLAMTAGGDMEALAEMLEGLSSGQITELMYAMLPMLLIIAAAAAALLIPLMYRFRMAEYVILEEPRARGLSAMLISAAMMRRRRWQLFRLDLRFWWYYGLKVLCTLLCYGDLLLTALGVHLPVGEDAAYLITYGLYLAALFAVEVAFRPQVDTAYALAFEAFQEMGPVIPKPAEKPENLPWDEE